jgi:hypothetical protein
MCVEHMAQTLSRTNVTNVRVGIFVLGIVTRPAHIAMLAGNSCLKQGSMLKGALEYWASPCERMNVPMEVVGI